MENWKGRLNELCQKQSFKLPVYSTHQYGKPHEPTFIGHCELNGTLYSTQNFFPTAKAAEQEAAMIALQRISLEIQINGLGTTTVAPTDLPTGNLKDCLCIVDLDNQNKFKELISVLDSFRNRTQNVHIIGVGGPRLFVPEIAGTQFRRTDILTKDAADLELTIDAYKFVTERKSVYKGKENTFRVRVFSTDFALAAIVDIIKRETPLTDVSFHCNFLEWLNGQKLNHA